MSACNGGWDGGPTGQLEAPLQVQELIEYSKYWSVQAQIWVCPATGSQSFQSAPSRFTVTAVSATKSSATLQRNSLPPPLRSKLLLDVSRPTSLLKSSAV